jgi:hypothetical protein
MDSWHTTKNYPSKVHHLAQTLMNGQRQALAMAYSRHNPSPRYQNLVALYRQMHAEGIPHQGIPPSKLFIGASLLPNLPKIKALIAQTGATSLLDYGAGKGFVYRACGITLRTGERISTVRDYLGVQRIVCFDPAVQEHMDLPNEKFDGVISTDVLEHCPEQDLPWIIEEMFAVAGKFVFANIACYPAAKRLPNGENAHCTIRPQFWWNAMIESVARRHPDIVHRFDVSTSYS